MNLLLNLPPDLESELSAEAAQLGIPLAEHAVRILTKARSPRPSPSTGAELVAYWQSEGLIEPQPNSAEVPELARLLRDQAQNRTQQ